jgi:hypothetical protein
MNRYSIPLLLWIVLTTSGQSGEPLVFQDVGEKSQLLPAAGGIRGHGVAWGDLDGKGYPDLFIASFHNAGSKPGMLLRNDKGKFTLDKQELLQTSGMGSGALFVDLNNSGRLDLYVSNCAYGKTEPASLPSRLFRNDGAGKFTDISKESRTCLPNYCGRGLSALDFDGDGKLDLVMCERYYGAVKVGPALFKNEGNYKFQNVGSSAGLPPQLSGLGVAVADLNQDGWPDLFLTEGAGDHRLLLNDKHGKFVDVAAVREVFRWKTPGPEENPAGVCIADVNRDGLPDIVIGHHYKTPWRTPEPIRLYLHRGVKDGVPTFEDVSAKAGLNPLKMKAPHVEIQDFDNDGWPDIYVSIVKFKDGVPHPMIYRNLGVKDGIPQFSLDAWSVNDWPNADDLAPAKTGDFYNKMVKDKKIIYMAAGPSTDFDRDGRVDIFLANWWIEMPSLLLRNDTKSGNWIDLWVEGSKGVNRMGVGSQVRAYETGKLGDPKALLYASEIAIGYGYCSGQEAYAHLGLGKVESVDLEIVLPHGKGTITRKGVKANQTLRVKVE